MRQVEIHKSPVLTQSPTKGPKLISKTCMAKLFDIIITSTQTTKYLYCYISLNVFIQIIILLTF